MLNKEPSGKRKSKSQWDITSHLSRWLSSKITQITNIDKDVEKREPSYTVNWECKLMQPLWKTTQRFLKKKLKIELLYDPAIPFLGTLSGRKQPKTLIWKDTGIPVFTAALFTIVEVWKQPLSVQVGLKLNIQKTKIMASGPITSWQIDGETMETVTDFIFGYSTITADGDYSHEIKTHLLLGRKFMTNLDSIL